MGAPKKYQSEEEKKAVYKLKYKEWVSKPENAKKNYIANQKTQSERHRRWRQNNKDKTRLKSANERAMRLQRIPPWSNLSAIKEFYLNCPTGHHVDHIIPLRGKTVSGLHILENLQYLPAKENLSKGNKFA
jgi:5-methylcytosine-specific restriction endonuclease McrA